MPIDFAYNWYIHLKFKNFIYNNDKNQKKKNKFKNLY